MQSYKLNKDIIYELNTIQANQHYSTEVVAHRLVCIFTTADQLHCITLPKRDSHQTALEIQMIISNPRRN